LPFFRVGGFRAAVRLRSAYLAILVRLPLTAIHLS
jgi:hypothetical protein